MVRDGKRDDSAHRLSRKCFNCGRIASGRSRFFVDRIGDPLHFFDKKSEWLCDACHRRHRIYSFAMIAALIGGALVVFLLVVF